MQRPPAGFSSKNFTSRIQKNIRENSDCTSPVVVPGEEKYSHCQICTKLIPFFPNRTKTLVSGREDHENHFSCSSRIISTLSLKEPVKIHCHQWKGGKIYTLEICFHHESVRSFTNLFHNETGEYHIK